MAYIPIDRCALSGTHVGGIYCLPDGVPEGETLGEHLKAKHSAYQLREMR